MSTIEMGFQCTKVHLNRVCMHSFIGRGPIMYRDVMIS